MSPPDRKSSVVLVTGGAGYIGSHICKALALHEYLPVAYDSLVLGNEWAVRWGPLERGDIADAARLQEVIHGYIPIAVIHCAAYAYVGESISDPARYYRNNVAGSLTLLEVLTGEKIPVVFSSTCATYGIPETLPIFEHSAQRPVNPYGASKLMVERLLKDFGSAYGLRSVILRYFNAAGADPESKIGECHQPETHLIPQLLAVAAGESESVPIFGCDYDTADGTCIRDYVHVSDLADAHVLALKWLLRGGTQEEFNLGIGKGFSVRQIVSAVERVTCRRVNVVIQARRQGDPPALVSDADKARRELGWTPKFTNIDDIISTAWEWQLRMRESNGQRPSP